MSSILNAKLDFDHNCEHKVHTTEMGRDRDGRATADNAALPDFIAEDAGGSRKQVCRTGFMAAKGKRKERHALSNNIRAAVEKPGWLQPG